MAGEVARKPNRLKGMKLRDEFVCPITFEVMSDPVVASDGHTYEKSAIEKWLRSSSKSPRNGEPITRTVISNLNLKKLIQDMISEGGSGLYTVDIADHSRLFDVYPEKIIYMKCLGPPESDWNGNSFSVTPFGCLGGRKVVNPLGREVVSFRDSTVSRMHFEVMCDASTKKYMIRDLGSAGGTFIRIPYGERKELHPGMMLLIGKHQFTVSSIDMTRPKEGASTGPGADAASGEGAGAAGAVGGRPQQAGAGFFTPPNANSPAPGAGPGVRAPVAANRVASRPSAGAGASESDAGAMIDSIVNEASLLIQQLSGGDEASAAGASAVAAAAAAEDGGSETGSGSDAAATAAADTVVGTAGGGGSTGTKDIDSRLKVLSNKMSHLRMINSNNQQHMAVPPSAPVPSSASSSSALIAASASAPQPLSSMEEEVDAGGEHVHSPLRKRQNVNKDSDISGQRHQLTCEATMNFLSSRSDGGSHNGHRSDPSALPAPPGDSQAMDEEAQGNSNSSSSGMARDCSSANLSAAGDNEGEGDGDGSGGEDAESMPTSKRCTITCFAPDGSPMQGRAFVVDSEGAMIGRKFGNKIPMYVFVVEADKAAAEKAARESGAAPVALTPTKIVNIDNAVSAEHARIEMDPKTGKFYVMDGTASRSSTNGTWVRLSGPCQESPFTPVKSSTEILVGTVRFIVSESMTILEKAVDGSTSSNSGATSGSAVKVRDH